MSEHLRKPSLAEIKHAIETRGKHTAAPYLWRELDDWIVPGLLVDDPWAMHRVHRPILWPLQEGTKSEVSDE